MISCSGAISFKNELLKVRNIDNFIGIGVVRARNARKFIGTFALKDDSTVVMLIPQGGGSISNVSSPIIQRNNRLLCQAFLRYSLYTKLKTHITLARFLCFQVFIICVGKHFSRNTSNVMLT